jgi:ribosomal protein S18 acetylase RimI-like enzyme
VGYVAVAAPAGEANAYLQTLVVDRAYRRRGIAGRLLAEAGRWAAAQGAAHLLVDVPARNYAALCLLQKTGFAFCGYNERCYPQHEVAVFFAARL